MGSWPWRDIATFATIFVASLVVSLAITSAAIVCLPADYFVGGRRSFMPNSHRALRVVVIVLKNTLGIVLVVVGIVLSVPGVPGQGFLTVLIGLMLVDFPGKFAVKRWIMRRKSILRGANWIRRKAGRAPLSTT